MVIALAGTLLVPEPDRPMVEALLADHVAATRAEPGCLLFQVVADRCSPGRYLVAERFTDAAAFEAHQIRTRASVWGQATAHLVRHYQKTEGA